MVVVSDDISFDEPSECDECDVDAISTRSQSPCLEVLRPPGVSPYYAAHWKSWHYRALGLPGKPSLPSSASGVCGVGGVEDMARKATGADLSSYEESKDEGEVPIAVSAATAQLIGACAAARRGRKSGIITPTDATRPAPFLGVGRAARMKRAKQAEAERLLKEAYVQDVDAAERINLAQEDLRSALHAERVKEVELQDAAELTAVTFQVIKLQQLYRRVSAKRQLAELKETRDAQDAEERACKWTALRQPREVRYVGEFARKYQIERRSPRVADGLPPANERLGTRTPSCLSLKLTEADAHSSLHIEDTLDTDRSDALDDIRESSYETGDSEDSDGVEDRDAYNCELFKITPSGHITEMDRLSTPRRKTTILLEDNETILNSMLDTMKKDRENKELKRSRKSLHNQLMTMHEGEALRASLASNKSEAIQEDDEDNPLEEEKPDAQAQNVTPDSPPKCSFQERAAVILRQMLLGAKSTFRSEGDAYAAVREAYLQSCERMNVKPNSKVLTQLPTNSSGAGAHKFKHDHTYNFSNAHVGDRGVVCLLHALAHDPNCCEVSLRGCGLRGASALSVASFVELNAELTWLDLSENEFSYEAGEFILEALERRSRKQSLEEVLGGDCCLEGSEETGKADRRSTLHIRRPESAGVINQTPRRPESACVGNQPPRRPESASVRNFPLGGLSMDASRPKSPPDNREHTPIAYRRPSYVVEGMPTRGPVKHRNLTLNLGGTPLAWDRAGGLTIGPPCGNLWARDDGRNERLSPSAYERLRVKLDDTKHIKYNRRSQAFPCGNEAKAGGATRKFGGITMSRLRGTILLGKKKKLLEQASPSEVLPAQRKGTAEPVAENKEEAAAESPKISWSPESKRPEIKTATSRLFKW